MTDIELVVEAKREVGKLVRERLELARVARLAQKKAPKPRYDDEFYAFTEWLDANG